MAAYRCSTCSLNWPTGSKYQTCPSCGGDTQSMANATAMSKAEAQAEMSRINHEKFRDYYEEREAERQARGEPSPEELAAQEREFFRWAEAQFA